MALYRLVRWKIFQLLRCKDGKKERESVHPLIDHILEETQGIIVYQEQVMQIAQVMAGYSLGGAAVASRDGKKNQRGDGRRTPKFEKGAAENGVEAKKASEVFDLLKNLQTMALTNRMRRPTPWFLSNRMAGEPSC